MNQNTYGIWEEARLANYGRALGKQARAIVAESGGEERGLMKREREEITLADILLCVLTWTALGLGLAWAF